MYVCQMHHTTVIPPAWEHAIEVLMKMPNSTAEGQNMRAWVTHYSLFSLEDFLMWELVCLQYVTSQFAFLL